MGRAGRQVPLPGQVRAGARAGGDGEGTARTGGHGTLRQVELQDGSCVRVWTAAVAVGRGVGRHDVDSCQWRWRHWGQAEQRGQDSTGHREAHAGTRADSSFR